MPDDKDYQRIVSQTAHGIDFVPSQGDGDVLSPDFVSTLRRATIQELKAIDTLTAHLADGDKHMHDYYSTVRRALIQKIRLFNKHLGFNPDKGIN